MRLFLSTDTVGGVWDYTCTLAHHLQDRGHRLCLAILGSPSPKQRASLPSGVEVTVGDFRLDWMPAAERDVEAAGRWLARAARRWGAHLVHLNQLPYAIHSFGVPTVVVAHSDVLSWHQETRGCAAGKEWNLYASAVKAGLRSATCVVAPSEYQSALLRRHYGQGAHRIIPNAAPLPSHAPPPLGERLPHAVLSVGRAWDEAKGMAVLDRAALRLQDRSPTLHLLGATCGPPGECFQARSPHLRLHGPLPAPKVACWMKRVPLYVGASLYEPFGLAPLQAALSGTPLLLSDIPSFRELWSGAAEFFSAGEEGALAEKMESLLQNPEHLQALALAALSRARERFSPALFVERYLLLYQELLGAAGRAEPAPSHAFPPLLPSSAF